MPVVAQRLVRRPACRGLVLPCATRGAVKNRPRRATPGRRCARARKQAAHPPSKRILRTPLPGASSGQDDPRHMGAPVYRCFLPDLTGFAGSHCVGPGHRRRASADCSAGWPLGRGFSPAVADCGYRAPLAPRLARPSGSLPAALGECKRGASAQRLRRPAVRPTRAAGLVAHATERRVPAAAARSAMRPGRLDCGGHRGGVGDVQAWPPSPTTIRRESRRRRWKASDSAAGAMRS